MNAGKLWKSPGLSDEDKQELGNLIKRITGFEDIADYPSNPSSQEIFRKIESLMLREAEDAITELLREVDLITKASKKVHR